MVATASAGTGMEGGRPSERKEGSEASKGDRRSVGPSDGRRRRRESSPSTCSETEQSRSQSPPLRFLLPWRRRTGGIAVGTGLRCRHGLRPRRKVCWAGKNTGRRFLGCSLEEDEDQCNFVQWCDEEWPERAQRYLVELWKVIRCFQRMEEEARRDLRAAVQQKEEELRRNAEEVEEAKTVARNACLFYQTRAASEADEKKRAWLVVAILGGLLVAMVFGLIVRKQG
ncbi:hypothetical protein ACP70R_041408 [Stipagrostis hirtigluma subsp. patula]